MLPQAPDGGGCKAEGWGNTHTPDQEPGLLRLGEVGMSAPVLAAKRGHPTPIPPTLQCRVNSQALWGSGMFSSGKGARRPRQAFPITSPEGLSRGSQWVMDLAGAAPADVYPKSKVWGLLTAGTSLGVGGFHWDPRCGPPLCLAAVEFLCWEPKPHPLTSRIVWSSATLLSAQKWTNSWTQLVEYFPCMHDTVGLIPQQHVTPSHPVI